jgi:hypothetical protein
MAIPGFFRQNKPRGFKYVPRYYDPQKEEWDQKRMARSMEQGARGMGQADDPPDGVEAVPQSGRARGMEQGASGAGNPESKPYKSKIMRGSMKNYFPRNREKLQKQSMIRFIVILIILAFVIYIYLRY